MAKWIVQIDESNLRVSQIAVHLIFNKGNVVCSLLPVGRTHRENPFKHFAVHRVAAADERLHQNIAVLHGPRKYSVRDRCGQKVEDENTVALELLVTFHAALGFVAVIAHDDLDRMAFDASVFIRVHRKVLCGLGDLWRNEGVRLAEVEAQSEPDRFLVLRGRHRCASRQRSGECHRLDMLFDLHLFSPVDKNLAAYCCSGALPLVYADPSGNVVTPRISRNFP